MSFDEMYDEMMHEEFRASAPGGSSSLRGLARYRTTALISAGGLACAAAGAFLGGLGGYFPVSPSSASPLTSSSEQVPLAAASNASYHPQRAASATRAASSAPSHSANVARDSGTATFAVAPGPRLNGAAPLTGPSVSPPATTPPAGSTPPVTTTPPGNAPQGGQIITASLNEILGNLTGALKGVLALPAAPSAASLSAVVTPLSGIVSDMTGTLSNLGSLIPLSGAGSLPVVSTLAPSNGSAASSRSGPSSAASALAPVLNSVAASLGGSTGSGLPSIPSLPLTGVGGSAPAVPSLPVTTPSGSLPTLPVITVPPLPVGTTGGSGTCVTVPVPALPLPSIPLHLGPVSVGVNTSGDSSGATVCVP